MLKEMESPTVALMDEGDILTFPAPTIGGSVTVGGFVGAAVGASVTPPTTT
jgi:hypothetical protein